MSRYAIESDTLTGIADAVRGMRHEKQLMTPATIEAKIRASRLGIPISVDCHINPETGEWERPADWPDLDILAAQVADDADCVYLTYDLRKTPGYGWIGVYVQHEKNDNPYWVERGHIEGGAFVVDESHEQISTSSSAATSTRFFRQALDDADGNVQIWRVRSDSHIIRFGFCCNSTVSAENLQNNVQPCVEKAGKLPYVRDLSSSINTTTGACMGTIWLERDAMVAGKRSRVTRLDYCWSACYSLQSLDVSGWDTTGWAVTSLAACWSACYSLQSLDVSGWDTTGWAVTSLTYCWQNCYSLQSLDVSGWDTTGWAVTSLYQCWGGLRSLPRLDISGWDTRRWAVTDTRDIFTNPESTGLRELLTPASFGIVANQANASGNPNIQNLETFTGWAIYVNHSYNQAWKLTTQSLVNIIDRLPTVTAARTLTLGQTNKLKLTAAQIAVATQKGWTIA